MQWSTTHIHLAGEDEHEGVQHQHSITAHQRQLASNHTDPIDVAGGILPHSDTNKVVELERSCTQFHGKLYAIIPFTVRNSSQNLVVVSNSLVTPYRQEPYQTYHQYTSIRLRAPPLLS